MFRTGSVIGLVGTRIFSITIDTCIISTGGYQLQFHHILWESDVEITAMKPNRLTSAISYSLKVLHREKKSDYSVQKWGDAQCVRFESVTVLKCRLKQNFSDILGDVEEDEIETGFIEPGHGVKGKQHWIVEDDDLQDMHKHTKGKRT